MQIGFRPDHGSGKVGILARMQRYQSRNLRMLRGGLIALLVAGILAAGFANAPALSNDTALAATSGQPDSDQAAQNFFYSQRAFPQTSLPANALTHALQQRETIPTFKPQTNGQNPNLTTPWTALWPCPY